LSPHRTYCICKCLVVLRVATLSPVYVSVYRPTFWFRYFWGCFRLFTSQTCTRFSIQVFAQYPRFPPPTTFPSSRPLGHWVQARFPLPLSQASSYVYSWHLLYLSLDGVISEAFIYVYITYNITCVSSVDCTVDRVNLVYHYWCLCCKGKCICYDVVSRWVQPRIRLINGLGMACFENSREISCFSRFIINAWCAVFLLHNHAVWGNGCENLDKAKQKEGGDRSPTGSIMARGDPGVGPHNTPTPPPRLQRTHTRAGMPYSARDRYPR
jgi:hypothetical protein